MQFRAWVATVWLLRRMPLRMAYAVATGIGYATWCLWARGRRNAAANFRVVFPDAPHREVRAIGRASLVNYLRYLVDFARMPSRSTAELVALSAGNEVFWEVERLRASGRGCVIFAMHFGIWDLPAAGACARGLPVTAVVDRFADPRLDRLIARERERLGLRVLPIDGLGPSLVKGLRRGGVLALLVDRPDAGGGAVTVDFFGRPTQFPAGPARLALQTGAALVPLCAVRAYPWSPRATVHADFSVCVERTGDLDADVQRLTQAAVAIHEAWIRRYPEQWYMFRALWPPARGGASC